MAIKINNTDVIDNSRNAVNLASVTSTGSITADSDGNIITLGTDGGVEIFRSGGGAYIDFKNSSSEDYDVRISNPNNTTDLQVTGNLVSTGTITGSSIAKSGGSDLEFLKADGTVDNTTYASVGKSIALAMVFGF